MEYSVLDVIAWLNRHTIRYGLRPLSFRNRLKVFRLEFSRIFWPEPPKIVKVGDPEHWEYHFFDMNRRVKPFHHEVIAEYERARKRMYASLTPDGQAELDMVLDRDSRRRCLEDVPPIRQLKENGRYDYRRENHYAQKR